MLDSDVAFRATKFTEPVEQCDRNVRQSDPVWSFEQGEPRALILKPGDARVDAGKGLTTPVVLGSATRASCDHPSPCPRGIVKSHVIGRLCRR